MLRDFHQEIPFGVILDSIDSAIIVFDTETLQALLVNKRANDIYGLAAGHSIGHSLVALATSGSRRGAQANAADDAVSGGLRRFCFSSRDKHGRSFPAEVQLSDGVVVGDIKCSVMMIRETSEHSTIINTPGNVNDTPDVVGDITGKKRAPEELTKYEEHLEFRDLANKSPVGIYLVQDGVFQYVNPRFAKMYGFTEEELIDRKGPRDLVPAKDWPTVKDRLQPTDAGTERGPVRFRGKTNSGQVIECEAYSSRTVYRGRLAAIGTVIDDTERKRAEEQILAFSHLVLEITRAQDFQEALEVCLMSALRIAGMKGGAAYAVNGETGDFELVCSRGSVKGFKKLASTDDVDAQLIRMIMLEKPIYGNLYDICGLAHWLNIEETPSQIAILPVLCGGSLIACIFMTSPASKVPPDSMASLLEMIAAQVKGGLTRIWAEGAARRSVEKYWELMDGAPDAILLADADGIVLEANRKFEEIFGYEKPESVGRDFCDLLRPVGAKRVRQEFRKIVDRGSGPLAHVWMTKKDGILVPLAVTASVVEFGRRKLVQGIFRDITERKDALKALRRSEEKYRVLMDNAGDALILVSPDGKIIEANKKAAQLLGYTKEEFMYMNYFSLHPGREGTRVIDEGGTGTIDGSLMDWRAARKDGTLLPIDLTWSRIIIRGMPVIQVIMRDVSRRKRAEEALQMSEARYRTVFENTGTAMVIFERDMTISFVNTEFERMSCLPRTEIEGHKKWSDFVHGDAQQQEGSSLPCLASGYASGSLRLVPAVGPQSFRAVVAGTADRTVPVLVSIAALPDSERCIASLIDISPLVSAENVLRQSEERYRALVQQSSEGISIIEPRTKKLMEANEPFMNMLGYEPEDIQDLSLYDLIMESKNFIDTSVTKAMHNGHYFMGERNFRGNNGLVIDVDVAASAISYGNATFIMMSFRDVTEKKQMEGALKQAQKMEAIGTLAGGIAHDFSNIVQVIAGCAYQLSKKLKEKRSEELVGLAQQILSASEKASQLTQSILTFSRKQQIDPKPIDLNNAIKSIEKFLKRIVGEQIEFVTEYSPYNILIMADQVQVDQILMNVVTNARDAMPGGGLLRISASLDEIGNEFVRTRGYGAPGVYASISVSDTGTGMDEETKRRIFEPFYTTKKLGKGTGLGMAVVYGIVKQHNGYIDVESQLRMGTTVKVYFPLVAVTNPEMGAVEGTRPEAGGTETILLAEDETDVRTFVKGILEEAGYRVIEAENGEDAVERYAMHKDEIQLALLDVVMPKKDGKQAYEEMRRLKRTIKVIFMSGYSEDTVHRKEMLRSGTALLSKPVPPSLLLSKIRQTFDS